MYLFCYSKVINKLNTAYSCMRGIKLFNYWGGYLEGGQNFFICAACNYVICAEFNYIFIQGSAAPKYLHERPISKLFFLIHSNVFAKYLTVSMFM